MTPEEIGLPAQAVESIRQVFSRFPGIEQAVLYGSRAKGNFRAGSDIDMTLKGDLNYRDLLNIELALDDLLLPWKIDLSLYAQIDNPALVEHIGRVGKALYVKG
ncbi:nucleotidyltransferase [Azotobacter vinelandii CA]|uniref:Nucleotidyltransferase n=3 Tax=Azotobacter vinelandii TaxID=354 RepID=C1DHA3_AZOVD|nr:nucleotidyltransferase domain-containing protein [Azotobacter vinelandii]ACO76510.1 nucleotidyltransferase [Azotobacter vinelandii DJ]AGK17369.1 nucleotidyltransferase [Azotobacter vinelandii CA]AGK19179.1 nucleotidyltransferase [Azotobacter vinelandii CA6]WKN22283.1 nucleotidyltransferase domain-containing protein [Azotobacter vinelandii]SFX09663.1 Predicted nucleotidyltransferase [Azotobacter vinelandii]